MMLGDSAIKKAIEAGEIVITPFNPKSLGTNSYDLHLSDEMGIYVGKGPKKNVLDCQTEYKDGSNFKVTRVPSSGLILQPGTLYLASTIEYTESHKHVPQIEGRSSIGRLGIFAHVTAGFGDVGFCGTWTLEITVVQPVIIYPKMPIVQLFFHEVAGQIDRQYQQKENWKYGTKLPRPQPSKMYKWFNEKE